MSTLNRRTFLTLAGATTLSLATPKLVTAQPAPRHVIVVGGGFGGASAAKYLRRLDNTLKVTLIEPNQTHITCPLSNWIFGGFRKLADLTQNYEQLKTRHGVTVLHDAVVNIDPEKKQVKTKGGENLRFDRLILSTGISFKNNIQGYDRAAWEVMPHAWLAAGEQTLLLQRQLEAMPDGGTVVMTIPPDLFRCPPGPYERASMIAHYLKTHKPKSKLLMLDAKDRFSKKDLFMQGWKDLYGFGTDNSLIEWRGAADDGLVVAVSPKEKMVITDLGEKVKGDVVNVIPHQQAHELAIETRLTNQDGWCAVNNQTWESKVYPFIHVIGDSSIAGAMPKSGFSANAQAKVCAAAVVDLLHERAPRKPNWVNTCYSLVGYEYAISIAGVYGLKPDGSIGGVEGAGGVTPMDGNRKLEAIYADSWYKNMMDDIYG